MNSASSPAAPIHTASFIASSISSERSMRATSSQSVEAIGVTAPKTGLPRKSGASTARP